MSGFGITMRQAQMERWAERLLTWKQTTRKKKLKKFAKYPSLVFWCNKFISYDQLEKHMLGVSSLSISLFLPRPDITKKIYLRKRI